MYQHKKNGSWVKPKSVPADALVRYWCGDDGSCAELLKLELFQACKDGHVEYRMKEHKLNYPVEVLFAEHNLYIHLDSFETWAAGNVDDSDKVECKERELEYWQTAEVDEEAFDKANEAFLRDIDKAVAEKQQKDAEAIRDKQAAALIVAEEEGSYTPETYEYVIATLDACLMGRFKDKKFRTDKDLRKFIADVYDNLRGISVSNLNHVIAAARTRLKDTHDPKENENEILGKYKM